MLGRIAEPYRDHCHVVARAHQRARKDRIGIVGEDLVDRAAKDPEASEL